DEEDALAAVDGEEAFVAGAEPVVVEGGAGGVGVEEVALHAARAADPELAADVLGDLGAAVVADGDLGGGEGGADARVLPAVEHVAVTVGGVVGGEAAGEVGVLGEAPALDEGEAGLLLEGPGEGRVERGGGDHDAAEGGDLVAVEADLEKGGDE